MTEVGIVESAESVLCPLYKDASSLKRLFDGAGLDVSTLEFAGDHRSVMNGCLRTARGQDKLTDVIKKALRDFPDHAGLKGLSDKFELERPITDNIVSSVKDLGGFRVLLRRSRHLTRDELNKFDAALQRVFDLTELAESRRKDGDANSGQWDDLSQAMETCLGRFQLYSEILDSSAKTPRRRFPGAPDMRFPLAEVADDRMTLIEAKLDLLDAVNDVVQSCRSTD